MLSLGAEFAGVSNLHESFVLHEDNYWLITVSEKYLTVENKEWVASMMEPVSDATLCLQLTLMFPYASLRCINRDPTTAISALRVMYQSRERYAQLTHTSFIPSSAGCAFPVDVLVWGSHACQSESELYALKKAK